MWQKILLTLAALTFLAACSTNKKDDSVIDTVEVDGGGISEQPLSYDPMGSDSGNIPGLSTIRFPYDQFSLTPTAREALSKNADWMKGNANASLQIEGHCDSRGSIEYNLTLGERRANAVKSYMVSIGAPDARLSVISYGEERPLDGSDTDSAHSANRRANFVPVQ